MNHPDFPLKFAELRAIREWQSGDESKFASVPAIREHFRKRRDSEFPDWWNKYEAEMSVWFESQKVDV